MCIVKNAYIEIKNRKETSSIKRLSINQVEKLHTT